jgi:hypothetical protein
MPGYDEFLFTATQAGVVKGLDLRAGLRLAGGEGVSYPSVLPARITRLAYQPPKVFFELAWSR